VSFFQLVIATQVVNAVALPLVFYYLIKFTSSRELMGAYANNGFQKTFAAVSTWIIVAASVFTVASLFFKL